MPDPNPAALDFLLTRRSRPAKTLTTPAPTKEQLLPILTAAARTPDHKKLEPWRFIVFQGPALQRLADQVQSHGNAQSRAPDAVEKARRAFADSPLCVAVIETPKDEPSIPAVEQTYSVGAACLALLNAALASGWGANWLSGWASHEPVLMQSALGLASHERVAGFIHIGTETSRPPERPRPTIEDITEWRDT